MRRPCSPGSARVSGITLPLVLRKHSVPPSGMPVRWAPYLSRTGAGCASDAGIRALQEGGVQEDGGLDPHVRTDPRPAPRTSITWNWRKARQNGVATGSSMLAGRKTMSLHRIALGAVGVFQKIW